MKIRRLLSRLRKEIRLYFHLFRDRRTPKVSKILILIAIIYLVLPIDLIPDYFPLAGQIDDLIIVPIIFMIATFFIPKIVVEESKLKAKGKRVEKSKKAKFENVQEGEIIV